MFTGIVTAVGIVSSLTTDDDRMAITIDAPFADLQEGESVAVNGACLTVTRVLEAGFSVDAIMSG